MGAKGGPGKCDVGFDKDTMKVCQEPATKRCPVCAVEYCDKHASMVNYPKGYCMFCDQKRRMGQIT